MNNWRLLLFAVVAVLLPVGSFTERSLFDGREQCCDHRSDFPDARLHGTYRKITQEDRRLSTRLLTDRLEAHDTRRHETRYANPLTRAVERRFTESERSAAQERRQRNLHEARLSRIVNSRRDDLTRNDPSLDSTRRHSLENVRSERRTQPVQLNPNSRTENERRMRVRTERNEIRKDARPTEESIRHELRLKNERVVVRLRQNMGDSRSSRISEERREFRRMTTYVERRQGDQRYSRESVERRDVEPQQKRSYNQQSRDRELSVLLENRRREIQRHLSRDPLDTTALRMREIRSLDRLERVRNSRDIRSEARSSERLERTSERSDRMSRLSESRIRAEPQRVSLSRVENSRDRLNVLQSSDVRNGERLEVRNRNIETRAVSKNSVRKDFRTAQRYDRAESERRIINARHPMERVSEERRETHRMSQDDPTKAPQIVRARIVKVERNWDTTREVRERSDIRNLRNQEVTRDRRAINDRPESRTEFGVIRERSLELSRNLDGRNMLFSVRNIQREVTRDRRSVDYRSGEVQLSREKSLLERSRNLEARDTPTLERKVRDSEREGTRDRRSVDARSDSHGEIRLSRERSSMERSRLLESRNARSSERNVRDSERKITNDRKSVDDRSNSRREIRLNKERSLLERSRNLESRNRLSSERNVRNTEQRVNNDRRSVDDRSDSREEIRLSRERSSLQRSRNLARNSLSSERNVRNTERRFTRDRRSVDDRADSREEVRLSRERSSLERSRNLARNRLSSERNVRNTERRVTNDRRSVDDRFNSRGEIRLDRERSFMERSRNLEARNIRSSEQNVRDIERELIRDRRSVDTRSETRGELRLSRERSSMEHSSDIKARNTLSAVRNIRENQRESVRDRKSVDRIDSRRDRLTLDRSRSSEARQEREIMNRAVRNERQTQREQNERSMIIRPQIDRLVMERNDRNTESRNGNQAEFLRVREINEKTKNQDGTWQYMFYTLQGVYLCGLLLQMLTENSMKSKTKKSSWWLPASNNVIKVD